MSETGAVKKISQEVSFPENTRKREEHSDIQLCFSSNIISDTGDKEKSTILSNT